MRGRRAINSCEYSAPAAVYLAVRWPADHWSKSLFRVSMPGGRGTVRDTTFIVIVSDSHPPKTGRRLPKYHASMSRSICGALHALAKNCHGEFGYIVDVTLRAMGAPRKP